MSAPERQPPWALHPPGGSDGVVVLLAPGEGYGTVQAAADYARMTGGDLTVAMILPRRRWDPWGFCLSYPESLFEYELHTMAGLTTQLSASGVWWHLLPVRQPLAELPPALHAIDAAVVLLNGWEPRWRLSPRRVMARWRAAALARRTSASVHLIRSDRWISF